MALEKPQEGIWLETIALFQQVRAGDHMAGMRLLETSADPSRVVHSFLRMLAVFLAVEDEDSSKLDRFLEAALMSSPPPLNAPHGGENAVDYQVISQKFTGSAQLSVAARKMLANQLSFLATTTTSAFPDISPEPSMRIWDEHTLIYNVDTDGQQLDNIRAGSAAMVALIDQEAISGFRFEGIPQIHESGEVYEAATAFAHNRGARAPKAAVLIHLAQIRVINSGQIVGA